MTCASFASVIDDVALGAPASRTLAAHLATCEACVTQLERRRALAQRIDGALRATVRAEPSSGFAERVVGRIPAQRSRRRPRAWLGVPAAGLALAAALLIVVSFGGLRAPRHATDLAALAAWRSPTDSLLVSRGSVLATPFSLPRRFE